jgi:hypothetical protein
LGKRGLNEHRPFGFGNTSRRFPQYITKREKGKVARDRFAFDQAMKGNDCTKIRRDGDFVVQERDFFGNKIGCPKVCDVKVGNAGLTEAQQKRKRKLGKDCYKIARY